MTKKRSEFQDDAFKEAQPFTGSVSMIRVNNLS